MRNTDRQVDDDTDTTHVSVICVIEETERRMEDDTKAVLKEARMKPEVHSKTRPASKATKSKKGAWTTPSDKPQRPLSAFNIFFQLGKLDLPGSKVDCTSTFARCCLTTLCWVASFAPLHLFCLNGPLRARKHHQRRGGPELHERQHRQDRDKPLLAKQNTAPQEEGMFRDANGGHRLQFEEHMNRLTFRLLSPFYSIENPTV